jgi:hypothetical protein
MEGGYNLVARIAKLGGRREIGTALPLESQPAWLLLPEKTQEGRVGPATETIRDQVRASGKS